MDPSIIRQFRMKCGGENSVLSDQDRLSVPAGQDLDALADAADARRPDEDAVIVGVERRLERIRLAAERVPFDVDVEEPPRRLVGMGHALGEQDGAGAGAEYRAAA